MPESRYFALNDDVGVAPTHLTGPDGLPVDNPEAGQLEPAREMALTIGVPTQVGRDIISIPQAVTLEPIAGTRVFKIDDPLVANVLGDHPHLHEVDPPDRSDLKAERDKTAAAREAAKTTSKEA